MASRINEVRSVLTPPAIISLLQPYLDKTLMITADNGKGFAVYETIKEQLSAVTLPVLIVLWNTA